MSKKKVRYFSIFWNITKKSKIIYLFITFLIMYLIFTSAIYYYDKASFNNFGDALWFTFVSIFTVGYGDYTVHTALSRVLTVILIIYGSVIIAIFTAIWVNLVSQVTKATVFNQEEDVYNKLCSLESLSKEELTKISAFFKKRQEGKKINKIQ